jgi:hypothetical protein
MNCCARWWPGRPAGVVVARHIEQADRLVVVAQLAPGPDLKQFLEACRCRPAAPGKASARSAIMRLRSCMVSTTCSSVQPWCAIRGRPGWSGSRRPPGRRPAAWRRPPHPSGRFCRRHTPAGRRGGRSTGPTARGLGEFLGGAGREPQYTRRKRRGVMVRNPLPQGRHPGAAHSSRLSSTAALPMSLARLDRSCHSGPMRSMAVSMPVLSSSTISTSTTVPASTARSSQLLPSQNAAGSSTARIASCRKAASPQPARRPASE